MSDFNHAYSGFSTGGAPAPASGVSSYGSTGSGTLSTASSLYGGQRPTFSEDGKGMPYTNLLNIVGNSALNQDISYDTSSKDPLMVRARVFIGNLGRSEISREDLVELFKGYGKLLAVTFFKQAGYAFVQFSEGHEADSSCTGLNGKRWKGAIIDVHLAMTGPSGTSTHRKKDDYDSYNRKRRYGDDRDRDARKLEAVVDETAEQNKRNRDIALTDGTLMEALADTGMADTLICGGCRFVTCDYESFKDHRIAGCKSQKDPDEPKRMKCASCDQRFLSCWALMCHLSEFHRMTLYKMDDTDQNKSKDRTPEKDRRNREDRDRLPSQRSRSPPRRNESPSRSAAKEPSPPPFFTPMHTLPATPSAAVGVEKETEPVAASALFQPIASNVSSPPAWNPMTGQTILSGGIPPAPQPPQQVPPAPIDYAAAVKSQWQQYTQ